MKTMWVGGVPIKVRTGWNPDRGVLDEWHVTYAKVQRKLGRKVWSGHVVLDIGANIGMFSVVALGLGARQAFCFEPEAAAYRMLQANLGKRGKAKLYNRAIGRRAGTVQLSIPPSGNATAASTVYTARGRNLVDVRQESFKQMVKLTQATLVKTDCEGAELDFLNGRRLPSHVRMVVGELHREHGNEERCLKVIKSFSKWEPIHEPASYSFSRCWTIAYRR